MRKKSLEFYVKRIESASPYVRISGYFFEGGTSTQSAQETEFNFLTSSLDHPHINQRLRLTIEEIS